METFFETHLNFYKGKTITVRNTAKLIQAKLAYPSRKKAHCTFVDKSAASCKPKLIDFLLYF